MSLSGSRPWVVAGVVVALLMAGLTWLLLVGPTRSDAASLRDDTVAAQTQNDVLMTRVDALSALAEDRASLSAQVRGVLGQVPADLALPGFNQELARHAASRGVAIVSVSVGAATAPAGTDLSATAGEVDPEGVLSVPITIETKGARLAQLYFLRDIQEVGPRAALVEATTLTADAVDGGTATDVTDSTDNSTATTMTVQLSVFSHALTAADAGALAGTVVSPDAG